MDGSGGRPNATGGIEQCQYSPRTGTFYLNVPQATISPGKTADLVLQIGPQSEKILNTVNLTTLVPNPGCVRITGMAVGPDHQLAIACGSLTSCPLGSLPHIQGYRIF